MKIEVWTLAQVQLIPDPSTPGVGAVGIQSVVKVPGVMAWDITLSPENGPAGSPDFCPIVTPLLPPGTFGAPVVSVVPFPPPGPVSTFRVAIVDATGATIPDVIGSVTFRLDRKSPTPVT